MKKILLFLFCIVSLPILARKALPQQEGVIEYSQIEDMFNDLQQLQEQVLPDADAGFVELDAEEINYSAQEWENSLEHIDSLPDGENRDECRSVFWNSLCAQLTDIKNAFSSGTVSVDERQPNLDVLEFFQSFLSVRSRIDELMDAGCLDPDNGDALVQRKRAEISAILLQHAFVDLPFD